MINKVTLVGNVGGDVEVRFMGNGNAVANLTLATNETWKDKASGERKTKTEWHRVVLFGKIAEIAGQYVKKGTTLYIEGKLQTREWEKDGVKRYSTEIVVDMGGTMKMMGGRNDSGAGQAQAKPAQAKQQSQERPAQAQPAPSDDNFDDDIPF